MARKKPVPEVMVTNLDEADQVLEELAELDRKVAAIGITLNEVIDAAKAKAKIETAVIEARKKIIESALTAFAIVNKATLFQPKKSIDLDFGVLSFRLSTKVETAGKSVTWDMVLGKLKEHEFTDAIRLKEEVNKDVLLQWDDQKLAKVGVKRKTEDKFGYDLKQHEPGLNQAI